MTRKDRVAEYSQCLATHRAGLLGESIDRLRSIAESSVSGSGVPCRGDLYRLLGDWLIEADRAPEAVQAYQRSTDRYLESGETAKSSKMAAIGVQTIKTFWRKPSERIQLLVVRFDQEIRDLADVEGEEWNRANIAFRCAQMLFRTGLFQESAIWYINACELFELAEGSEREQAVCHHRIADLYHHEIPDFKLACEHYEVALKLYSLNKPISEYDDDAEACAESLREVLTLMQIERE
ncbi:MAG: hypothetical protein ABJA67_15845 [Chthonomonadales bacterium]